MADDYDKNLDRATRPLDPYNPTPTGQNLNTGAYDQYGNARFEPVQPAGRGAFVLLGILVAIGVIGGLIYFNHTPRDTNTAQAPRITDTRPAPISPAAPGAAPLTTPAPAPSAMPAAPSDSGTATPPVRQ